jgi:hypothetical protein
MKTLMEHGKMWTDIRVKILPSGKAVARRKDGLPLTPEDKAEARKLADALRSKKRGITAADVLNIFPGARVVQQPCDEPKPSCCPRCDGDNVAAWRRGGKIIQHLDPDGTKHWACHFCGRQINTKAKPSTKKKRTR